MPIRCAWLSGQLTKRAMITFLKVTLSKCMDLSAHKTISVLTLTNIQQKRLYWFVVLTGVEIDCNLNRIAQKIPLESPSMRKILLQIKEFVILPRAPEPTCLGSPCRRPSAAPWHILLSQRNPLPGKEALLLHSGFANKDQLSLLALWTGYQRWKRVAKGWEAGVEMGEKGSGRKGVSTYIRMVVNSGFPLELPAKF